MQLKTASHLFFALVLIGIGILGLTEGGFAPIWRPVPDHFPARQLLAYLCTLVSLTCGAGLLARRTRVPAALALLVYLTIWTILFKVPFIVRAPLQEVTYQSAGENAVLIAAAWVLYAEFAESRGFPAGKGGRRAAYVIYGLALIAFGLSHFFYLQMTAPLVPGWLPNPIFWAYATGTIYLAAGIAVLSGFWTRPGALAAAAQISLITVLVWGPMIVASHMSAMHWQETVMSWALTGGASVLATGSPPATGSPRLPFRRDRSISSGKRR